MKKMILVMFSLISISAFSQTQPAEVSIELNSVNTSNEILARKKESYSYNFGTVRVGSPQYVRFTFTNSGDKALNFERAGISGLGFDAYHTCTGALAPQAKCTFDIRYNPWNEGFNTGTFILSFKEDLDIFVYLSAHAMKF